ncbi:MAG: hypothetical protein ACT4TC_26840 [Myxococcaceae bacterium]
MKMPPKTKAAGGLLLAVGTLHSAAGIASLTGVKALSRFGMDWKFAVIGVALLALGLLTLKGSRSALIAATVLLGGHALVIAAQLVEGQIQTPISSVLLRMILLIPLIEGVGALTQAQKAQSASTSA